MTRIPSTPWVSAKSGRERQLVDKKVLSPSDSEKPNAEDLAKFYDTRMPLDKVVERQGFKSESRNSYDRINRGRAEKKTMKISHRE
jgi:hypothetical protein